MAAFKKKPFTVRDIGVFIQYSGLLAVACLAVWWFIAEPIAKAAQVIQRSIVTSSAITSAVADHSLSFTYVSTTPIGSVSFEYCDNSPVADDPCNAPAGLDVTGASLGSQSGNTGFSFDNINTTTNRIVISRPSVAASAVASSYDFTGIINPSSSGSQFVRIKTYATTDGTGPVTDWGSVAWATVSPFVVGASVPPFLTFCVGITVASDCTTTSGDSIDFGNFSPNQPKIATSQFAVATNDFTGYSLFTLGTTMTSGNNIIPNPTVPQPSFPGTSQFGINLRDNAVPNIGINPTGAGTGVPQATYNVPNFFAYEEGDLIASSPLTTDFNRMTVSYIVNVNEDQPIGVYSTTVTYLATVSF